MQIGVITNPNSKKNRQRVRRLGELSQLVGDHGLVRETCNVEELKPVLREFFRLGVDYWVSDGGDGSLHWMLNQASEVLDEPEFSQTGQTLPTAVPTNGGTIDFVAKKAGLEGDATAILRSLTAHVSHGTEPDLVEVDTLDIHLMRRGSSPVRRIGFAVAAGGIGQRFFSYYYAHQRPSSVTIAKIFGATLLSVPFHLTRLGDLPVVPRRWASYPGNLFKPTRARVVIDGECLSWDNHTGIHAGAIDVSLGGLVRFFPRAREPGRLHFIVGNPSPLEIVGNIPNMVLGRNMRAATLWDGNGRQMTVEAVGDELLTPVIDGEMYRDVQSLDIRLGPPVRVPRLGRQGWLSGSRMMRLGRQVGRRGP